MKQIFTFLFIIIFTSIYSQNRIGLNAGISRTGINAFGTGGFGFQIGATYEIKISNNFLVRPNINYAFQGDRRPKSHELDLNRLNYLILPLDLIIQIKEKYRIIGGAQYSLLVSSDYPVKNTDFGIYIGYGQKIDDNIFINVKFYNGLFNISNLNEEKDINQYLNISIGYYFN